MMTQTQSLLISLAIIVVSIAFLAPRIVRPTQPVTLLNQTVILNEANTDSTQYTLALNKGDQLNIQLSGNGDLVSLGIAQSSSSSTALVDQEDQTTFTLTWTVPQTGSYIFTVSTPDDGATANFIVTKT
jgi:type II secretory pathway pseudopilin PulG